MQILGTLAEGALLTLVSIFVYYHGKTDVPTFSCRVTVRAFKTFPQLFEWSPLG